MKLRINLFVFSDELLYIPAISESRLCAYMPGFYVICIHGGQIHPRTLMTRRAAGLAVADVATCGLWAYVVHC